MDPSHDSSMVNFHLVGIERTLDSQERMEDLCSKVKRKEVEILVKEKPKKKL